MGRDTIIRSYSLEQVFTEKVLKIILGQCIRDSSNCEVIGSEVRPATDGISGFLGDHIRAVLHVKVGDDVRKVPLFVKKIPVENRPKAEFIDQNNYFRREKLMFQLMKEMKGAEGPNPWCAGSYIYTDSMLVMPDLAAEGYTVLPQLETLDHPHVMQTIASIARFHAAYTNYETNKSVNLNTPYNFVEEYEEILKEPTFNDSPWLRAAAKLSANLLDAFSKKYNKRTVPDLEGKLANMFIIAADSLKVEENTLNVIVHKDLWVNNILFKYEDGVPTNCLLIDYQCVRYGPAPFDITSFLYLNTTRRFRDENERFIFKYYYKIFSDNLTERSKKRLELLRYDEKEHLNWCEKSRLFGILEAIGIFPFVLMDPRTAEKTFDDPETYTSVMEKDRSAPVLKYARDCIEYRDRQIEVTEEFVERYVLNLM